ncbi:MAG TPA: AzlD domain-containing protein [Bacillota bacterium]|nr:AzlD domain-containing protein [Bacillota bacterium]HUM56815.1 AzlD domain-containing protein [Bacillota bacterium]
MDMTTAEMLLMVAAVTIGVQIMRWVPFALFPEGREVPEAMTLLSKVLPAAMMGMLVVYCFRNISPLEYPFGIPELISAAVVLALHFRIGNSILSIVAGTICYMIMQQYIFV